MFSSDIIFGIILQWYFFLGFFVHLNGGRKDKAKFDIKPTSLLNSHLFFQYI